MGNCTVVPTFCWKKKSSSTSSVTNETELPSSKRENYSVYHNTLLPSEASLRVAIKNRRKRSPQSNRVRTTRYNIITFLPKNLFDQFHRIANIYFAISIGLNWIPAINALNKHASFVPLTIILVITAVKDLVEDLKRWRSDSYINKQTAEVYDKISKRFSPCKWQDLSAGSVVRVRADQTVPADILLLSSSSPEHTCYLDTAAIDGETNLKQKSIPNCFLNQTNPEESSFELQCDMPNDDIYHFHGRLLISSCANAYSCDNNNFLLRGCVLRITDYVDGIIVYAGNQTKVIRSSQTYSTKHALIERYINRDVLFSTLILIFLCLLGAGLSVQFGRSFGDNWRLVPFIFDDPFDNAAGLFFTAAVRFAIICQVMVPIALYISLDLVRILQIYTIASDKKLKYEHPITCRTFTINEDLGQIGYVFSDKTGTLTQNKLVFKTMSVGGLQYSHRSELLDDENTTTRHFLTALAICNTSFIVHEDRELVSRLDYEPKYEGENPDDLVLCQTASNFGVRMIARSPQSIIVRYINSADTKYEDVQYEILCLLPFDSDRKRMSIIVRTQEKIFLFIKGAETSIWPNLSGSNDNDMKATTEQHSSGFAEQGYRLLLVAYRQLTSEEFEQWIPRYRLAANLLNNREEAISESAVEIEVDLMLAGLTAVEDKLQDGVPRAIASLRCAGIKIWLLTGDKQATALSTAQAASLVSCAPRATTSNNTNQQSPFTTSVSWDFSMEAQAQLNQRTCIIYYSTQLIEMDHERNNREANISEESRTGETIARMSEVVAAQTLPVCLVVTGDELGVILKHKPKEFIRVAAECQSVIYCRVSATQKRELVTVAKSIFRHRILAIGDGANDVGMIREAHCGVAVHGREGSQAVAAGDFAVDRFECLRRLLLVHGAWCFSRTSELVLFTFLHNCSFVFVIFYHQFFNGSSSAASLHSLYILLYSIFFANLPQCAAAVFDQHIPAERALREPQLYQYTLNAQSYQLWSYWVNFFDAVWQSTVIFFFAYFAYQTDAEIDQLAFGFSLVFSMVFTSMIHVLLQTSRIDLSLVGSIVLSILAFLGFTLIFDATCVACLTGQSPYYVSYHTFRRADFWLTNLLTIITAMLPRFGVKCVYNTTVNPVLRNIQ